MPLDEHDVSRLRDVLSYGEQVCNMVADFSQETFLKDPKTVFAVCYGIQIVGEAVWKLSNEFKKSETAIPWPLIAAMRHRLVHDYGRTDETIIYQVATVHIPLLLEQVRIILARSAGPQSSQV